MKAKVAAILIALLTGACQPLGEPAGISEATENRQDQIENAFNAFTQVCLSESRSVAAAEEEFRRRGLVIGSPYGFLGPDEPRYKARFTTAADAVAGFDEAASNLEESLREGRQEGIDTSQIEALLEALRARMAASEVKSSCLVSLRGVRANTLVPSLQRVIANGRPSSVPAEVREQYSSARREVRFVTARRLTNGDVMHIVVVEEFAQRVGRFTVLRAITYPPNQ